MSCERPATEGFSFGARYRDGGSFFGAHPVLDPTGETIYLAAPSNTSLGALFKVLIENGKSIPLNSKAYYQGQLQISADGRMITYVSERTGIPAVWIGDIDGSANRRLTGSIHAEHSPIFSPDGKQVAFVRRLTRDPDNRRQDEIFIADIDGSNERRITSDLYQDLPVRFSAKSRSLYIMSTRPCQPASNTIRESANLFVVSLDDLSVSCVFPIGVRWVGGCDLSADEQTVVYVDDADTPFEYEIYASQIDGTRKSKLTDFHGYIGSVKFGWHSDRFTFLLEPDGDGTGDVYLCELPAGNLTKILSTSRPQIREQ